MRLFDYYSDLLYLVIKQSKNDLENVEEFSEEVRRRLQSIKGQLINAGRDKDKEISSSMLAVIAFIDEKMTFSEYDYSNWWLRNTLQSESYGHEIAGELFYSRLKIIDHYESNKKEDLIELYLIILFLGFKGDKEDGDEQKIISYYADRLPYLGSSAIQEKLWKDEGKRRKQTKKVSREDNKSGSYLKIYYISMSLIIIILYVIGTVNLSEIVK